MQSTLQLHQDSHLAFTFPMGNVIARFMKDSGVKQEEADLQERELKRYLFLCAKYPSKGWPMVLTLDELWHTFIIFTKEYHEFCGQLGIPYIHHQPLVDGEDTTGVRTAYAQFLGLYRKDFGEPPSQIWPLELVCDCASCGSGCSGGGCSGIGCGSSCGSSCR